MAIHVEDHPIEYLDFEGTIPRGEYGAGDMIVWDWGTWVPERETPDPEAALVAGELKFRLFGQKLHGRFTIVRDGPASGSGLAGERRGVRRAVAPDPQERPCRGGRLGRGGPSAERAVGPHQRRGQGGRRAAAGRDAAAGRP